jgi:hypothetical protein
MEPSLLSLQHLVLALNFLDTLSDIRKSVYAPLNKNAVASISVVNSF